MINRTIHHIDQFEVRILDSVGPKIKPYADGECGAIPTETRHRVTPPNRKTQSVGQISHPHITVRSAFNVWARPIKWSRTAMNFVSPSGSL